MRKIDKNLKPIQDTKAADIVKIHHTAKPEDIQTIYEWLFIAGEIGRKKSEIKIKSG